MVTIILCGKMLYDQEMINERMIVLMSSMPIVMFASVISALVYWVSRHFVDRLQLTRIQALSSRPAFPGYTSIVNVTSRHYISFLVDIELPMNEKFFIIMSHENCPFGKTTECSNYMVCIKYHSSLNNRTFKLQGMHNILQFAVIRHYRSSTSGAFLTRVDLRMIGSSGSTST